MNDLLNFRRMVTPVLIQIIFWIGALLVVLLSILTMMKGGAHALVGLLALPAGLLLWRVYCELVIVVFRINETLTDILHEVERGPSAPESDAT